MESSRISNLPSIFPTIARHLGFTDHWPLPLEVRLRCVVTNPMSHVVSRRIRRPGNSHLNATELRVRRTLRRIVGEQVLVAEFVADLAEDVIELRHRSRVVVLASRVFRELDQSMLAANLASGAILDGQ